MPRRTPTVSVIVATHSTERWQDLIAAVSSVRSQTLVPTEIVVAVDHHDELLNRIEKELRDVIAVANSGAKGASGARNAGVAASHGEVVVFLDDDEIATPTWLERLLPALDSPGVVGVGGFLRPIWPGERPRWFPFEFDWVIGASYRGLPVDGGPVRNVWSGNMAIRREAFETAGGFRESFGKAGHRNRPEDTDLCGTRRGGPSGLDLVVRTAGRCRAPGAALAGRDRVLLPTMLERGTRQGGAGWAGRHDRRTGCGARACRRGTAVRLVREVRDAARRRDPSALSRAGAIAGGAACAAAAT